MHVLYVSAEHMLQGRPNADTILDVIHINLTYMQQETLLLVHLHLEKKGLLEVIYIALFICFWSDCDLFHLWFSMEWKT